MPKRTEFSVLESEIQRQILDYLKIKQVFCWRNNVGSFSAIHNGKKRFVRYSIKGSGDILGICNNGRFFSIEVKRPGNQPTLDQATFMKTVAASGGLAFVATCLEDVIAHGL